MALLGTPPAINGISPPRRNSKLFGGLRREMGNCGLPSRGLPPWFLGGTQQISRRLSPGKCFGAVGQSAAELFWGFGAVYPTGTPRRIAPPRQNRSPAIIGGASVGYSPQTVCALRRIAPLHQNTSPAIIDGIFVGYPPSYQQDFPPTNSLRPSAECAAPPIQFPGDNRRGICWVPPRSQVGRPREGSPQFPISRRSPPKSFEFRRGGKTLLIAGGVPNKVFFQNEGLL